MRGIAIAGSILVDRINEIEKYPTSGELTKILSVKLATGGCVPNVAIDLKHLSPDLPVYAIGRVGKDGDGEFAISVLEEYGVDVGGVKLADEKTSFTEVMSEVGGQRTFFTYPGASADFGIRDFELDGAPYDMLHLGYFLLLDRIDRGDGELVLKAAKARGIKTSIDLVSENSDRYSLVIPCLEYVDNLIINEMEAGKLTGIAPTRENLVEIARRLLAMGVKERVIIHEKSLGIAVTRDSVTSLSSFDLPSGFIKGTTGAGDAFCAGALLGIYEGKSDEEILRLATISAVGALSAADAISGMRELTELEELTKDFRRTEICL